MSTIDICGPEALDLNEYAAMQRQSFKELLEEMGVDGSFMTPEFYRWKYNTPFGPAKVIIGRNEGQLVAATMIQPTELSYKGRIYKAWQNGDTATLKEFRCLGLYPRCMKAAVKAVGEDELLFGFPNKNSIRGFSFFVKTDKGVLPLLARFSVLPRVFADKKVARVDRFDQLNFDFATLQNDAAPVFVRNAAFLDWRYSEHPINQYASYILRDNSDRICACTVTRNVMIGTRRVLLIMELHGNSPKAIGRLLNAVLPVERRGPFVMMFNSTCRAMTALRWGFVTVPNRFVPKKQALFALARGEGEHILSLPWQIQMGDWDGF